MKRLDSGKHRNLRLTRSVTTDILNPFGTTKASALVPPLTLPAKAGGVALRCVGLLEMPFESLVRTRFIGSPEPGDPGVLRCRTTAGPPLGDPDPLTKGNQHGQKQEHAA